MIIKQPEPDQIPQLRQLWQEAFGDPDAFLDGFFQTAFAFDRCRCAVEGSRVQGALYWLDCAWEGQKLAYLYAVATRKDSRGQGICRRLMGTVHHHLAA